LESTSFFLQFCLVSQMVATFGRVELIHKFLESFCLVFAIWFGVGSRVC
jgi:hypothetical protein